MYLKGYSAYKLHTNNLENNYFGVTYVLVITELNN